MKFYLECFFLILFFCSAALAADVPSNVTLTATETTVEVDWNGDTDADNYFVYWGTSSGDLDNRVTVDDSQTDYTITELEAGTTYYVAVSSNDNSQESDLSSVKSITTSSDTGAPEIPTGFTITGLNAVMENSAAFQWNQNTETDLDHYNVYYGTASGLYTTVLEAVDADASYFNITGLQEAARYYFTISAVDGSGNESDKADEVIVDTLPDTRAPNPPAGISGTLNSANSITVNVTNGNENMADFSGTVLYYGAAAGVLNEQTDLETGFSYTLTDLPIGSVWYFSAAAYDASGNESTRTAEISVTVEETFRFLNQPEDFDGGCFIRSAADPADQKASQAMGILTVVSIVLMFLFCRRRWLHRVTLLLLSLLVVVAAAGDSLAEAPEMPGNNILGVSAGYFLPLESDFKDYYGEDTFPVYGFYERFFSQFISIDLEAGFLKEKGNLLTQSGEETRIRTKLTLVPVSASLNFNMIIMPYVVGYVGAGPDYWYCQEEVDDSAGYDEIEEWTGGFHGKIGVRLYNTDPNVVGTGALLEAGYSQIDRFGDNDTDIGGWSFKFGLFYHF
jgi:fibronectin type 3 domain-containing protein